MKAETSQIPVNAVNEGVKPNTGSKSADAIWAHLRRLEAQVKSLELALSTARRDINRIDRKQYREVKELPPSEISGDGQREHSAALFG